MPVTIRIANLIIFTGRQLKMKEKEKIKKINKNMIEYIKKILFNEINIKITNILSFSFIFNVINKYSCHCINSTINDFLLLLLSFFLIVPINSARFRIFILFSLPVNIP